MIRRLLVATALFLFGCPQNTTSSANAFVGANDLVLVDLLDGGVRESDDDFNRFLFVTSTNTNATVLMIVISVPLGIISALRKDGIFDQAARLLLMVTLVMPAFWLGIIFLTYFSLKLQLFPVSGYGDTWPEHLHHLFLRR